SSSAPRAYSTPPSWRAATPPGRASTPPRSARPRRGRRPRVSCWSRMSTRWSPSPPPPTRPRDSWGNRSRRLPAGQRSRQPDPAEHAVVEAGQRADPVAGEGEDVQAGPVADAGRGTQVGPERRLAVGSRRDEVEPAARAEEAGAEP